MSMFEFGALLAVACAFGGLFVGGLLAWLLWRRPAPPNREAAIDTELASSLCHEMEKGTSPTAEATTAMAAAREEAQSGRPAAMLAVALKWEAAGGKPANRGAYNDAKRALETRV